MVKFRVRGWLSDEDFSEILQFARYKGRAGEYALFELDAARMRASGYTLRDVYAKLSSIDGVPEEDLRSVRDLMEEEESVTIKLEGGRLVVSSRTLLKPILEKRSLRMHYDKGARAYTAPPHMYYDVLKAFSEEGLLIRDELGLAKTNTLPRRLTFKGELRPYQEEALKAWEDNGFRGVLALPTGSGKTVIAIAAVAKLAVRTLVVVYTKDHVAQWIEAFRNFTDAQGLVGAYYSEEKRLSPITITTYQTAYRKLSVFAPFFQFIVFDEAHHLPADKFREIAYSMPAPFRMGLSATVEREDGRHVEIFPLVGGVVYSVTASELMEQGYLAPFTIRRVRVSLEGDEMLKYNELRREFQKLTRGAAFNEVVEAAKRGEEWAIRALRIHSQMRDIIQRSEAKLREVERIVKDELAKGSKIIVFTQFRDQAEELARRLRALLLHGGMSKDERRRVLSRFKALESGVLVVTTVGDEGLDIPDANVGVLVSGTGSRRQFVQRLGRLLRPKPGKKAVLYEVVAVGTSEEYQSRRRRTAV